MFLILLHIETRATEQVVKRFVFYDVFILLIIASIQKNAISVCPEPSVTNYTLSWNLEKELAFYYNYSAMVMRLAINRVDDDTIERVATVFRNPEEASQLILQDAMRNRHEMILELKTCGIIHVPIANVCSICFELMKAIDLKPIHSSLNDTREGLFLLENDINTTMNQIVLQENAILSELSTYKDLMDNIVKAFNAQLSEYQMILLDFTRRNDYIEESTKYVPTVLVLPLILVILSVIGLMSLFLRYLGNFCSDDAYEQYPIRNAVSDIGARILNLGGYIALFVSSILFLMVALCFVLAFASMFLCMGLFEDHDLRLLSTLPRNEFAVDLGKEKIPFVLYDILYKCRNGFSFFDAIDGDQIWARKEMRRKLIALRGKSFRRRLRNFYVDYQLVDDVSKRIVDLKVPWFFSSQLKTLRLSKSNLLNQLFISGNDF
uniref:Protein tweety homolog n=1 Tax=Angiostrongylus cantonensis TaxID=6313 RepID=A0A0K0CV41_ANGCA